MPPAVQQTGMGKSREKWGRLVAELCSGLARNEAAEFFQRICNPRLPLFLQDESEDEFAEVAHRARQAPGSAWL